MQRPKRQATSDDYKGLSKREKRELQRKHDRELFNLTFEKHPNATASSESEPSDDELSKRTEDQADDFDRVAGSLLDQTLTAETMTNTVQDDQGPPNNDLVQSAPNTSNGDQRNSNLLQPANPTLSNSNVPINNVSVHQNAPPNDSSQNVEPQTGQIADQLQQLLDSFNAMAGQFQNAVSALETSMLTNRSPSIHDNQSTAGDFNNSNEQRARHANQVAETLKLMRLYPLELPTDGGTIIKAIKNWEVNLPEYLNDNDKLQIARVAYLRWPYHPLVTNYRPDVTHKTFAYFVNALEEAVERDRFTTLTTAGPRSLRDLYTAAKSFGQASNDYRDTYNWFKARLPAHSRNYLDASTDKVDFERRIEALLHQEAAQELRATLGNKLQPGIQLENNLNSADSLDRLRDDLASIISRQMIPLANEIAALKSNAQNAALSGRTDQVQVNAVQQEQERVQELRQLATRPPARTEVQPTNATVQRDPVIEVLKETLACFAARAAPDNQRNGREQQFNRDGRDQQFNRDGAGQNRKRLTSTLGACSYHLNYDREARRCDGPQCRFFDEHRFIVWDPKACNYSVPRQNNSEQRGQRNFRSSNGYYQNEQQRLNGEYQPYHLSQQFQRPYQTNFCGTQWLTQPAMPTMITQPQTVLFTPQPAPQTQPYYAQQIVQQHPVQQQFVPQQFMPQQIVAQPASAPQAAPSNAIQSTTQPTTTTSGQLQQSTYATPIPGTSATLMLTGPANSNFA